jgi:membrane fusion protein (multidrug efflux system)
MDPASQPADQGSGNDRPAEEPRQPSPASPERPPPATRLRRWRRQHPRGAALLLALLIVVALGAVPLFWYLGAHQSTDDAQIDGHISALSTRVAGTVVAVFVEDNTPVKRGQLLVNLDPRDYEVALARARADLQQARATLEAESPSVPITATSNVTQVLSAGDEVTNAGAALSVAVRDHEAARARLAEAQANDTRAQADLGRYQFLLGQRAITQERYDQVLAAARDTRAQVATNRALALAAQRGVDEQRARLQQARSRQTEVSTNAPRQLSIRGASRSAREAAVQGAEAAVERARLDLDYTHITAPIDGITGKRSAEPGQHVQPGEQLFAIVNVDDLWVTANFKETQLRQLHPGQAVRIRVDALRQTLDGTVESLAGASGARYSLLPPENATGNYVKVVQRLPVRIRIDREGNRDAYRRLRPGMSVEPTVRVR